MKKAMTDKAHAKLRQRRDLSLEKARHNAEVRYAIEYEKQGIPKDTARRLARKHAETWPE